MEVGTWGLSLKQGLLQKDAYWIIGVRPERLNTLKAGSLVEQDCVWLPVPSLCADLPVLKLCGAPLQLTKNCASNTLAAGCGYDIQPVDLRRLLIHLAQRSTAHQLAIKTRDHQRAAAIEHIVWFKRIKGIRAEVCVKDSLLLRQRMHQTDDRFIMRTGLLDKKTFIHANISALTSSNEAARRADSHLIFLYGASLYEVRVLSRVCLYNPV